MSKCVKKDNERLNRIGLFDISMAALSIQEMASLFPKLIETKNNLTLDIEYAVISCGYIYSLNYYRDNPSTKKENLNRIQNLIKLWKAIYEMTRKIEYNHNVPFFKKQIEAGIQMITVEIESLVKDELESLNLKERLDRVQDKKSYLNNFFGIKKSRKFDVSLFVLRHTSGQIIVTQVP